MLLALIILNCNSCSNFSFTCENTPEKEVVSPDGNLKAVIYDRGCGATTGFGTGISVIPASQKIQNNDMANVFSADEIYRDISTDNNGQIQYGKVNFDVEWISDNELKVYYYQAKNIYKKDVFGNINIIYEVIK